MPQPAASTPDTALGTLFRTRRGPPRELLTRMLHAQEPERGWRCDGPTSFHRFQLPPLASRSTLKSARLESGTYHRTTIAN